jgi:hypothetical protein
MLDGQTVIIIDVQDTTSGLSFQSMQLGQQSAAARVFPSR